MQITQNLALIGGGNMGEALLAGILRAGLVAADKIWVTDVRQERLEYLQQTYGVQVTPHNPQAVAQAEIIILAVKPQQLKPILAQIRPVAQQKLAISIAAGVKLETLHQFLGDDVHLVRVMPNLPAVVGAGISALCPWKSTTTMELQTAMGLFGCVGETVVVEEHLLDAVTGLSGSGPGFVMVIIESLADAGVKAGLPRDISLKLAIQTLMGSAMLLKQKGLHPAQIKDMVTSPGGTTIAGIQVLECGGLRATLMEAVEAATLRAAELSK